MRVITLIIFISTLSQNIWSQDTEKLYQQVLAKHLSEGQLNEEELATQRFEYANNKNWNKEFQSQVRGVSSTISKPKYILKLKNPIIEISVK
jgi:hypothetical protein